MKAFSVGFQYVPPEFFFIFDEPSTVFPPIEAPGAKERIWGASIFCQEAPNFEINMIKKDSKMPPGFFQFQNTDTEHQFICKF